MARAQYMRRLRAYRAAQFALGALHLSIRIHSFVKSTIARAAGATHIHHARSGPPLPFPVVARD